MAAIEAGTHEAVEEMIVASRELLLEAVGLTHEPVHEALAYLLNLAVGLLYLLSITHLNGCTLPSGRIHHLLTLVDVGDGVVQGML